MIKNRLSKMRKKRERETSKREPRAMAGASHGKRETTGRGMERKRE